MKASLSLTEIKEKLSGFDLPEVDIIIGIAEGGKIPAELTSEKLECDLHLVKINFRDSENNPRFGQPKIIEGLDGIDLSGKKILLVDDVSVSGKTLNTAKTLFPENEIYSFVFKGKADFVLFPDIKTCVNWPWKSAG